MRLALTCLLYAATAWAQTPGAVDCPGVERDYQRMAAQLERGCAKRQDCHAENLAWDPCDWPIGHSSPKKARQLLELRARLHGRCGHSGRPCPAIFSEPICLDGRCEIREELDKLEGRSITLQFRRKNKPLKDKKVVLSADTGVRCAEAPCPSRETLLTLTTDKEGKALLPIGAIKKILTSSRIGPDGAGLGIEGIGFAALDIHGLLLDTRKIHAVEF